MTNRKLLFVGIVVLISSIVIGAAGAGWGIYSSFDALESAENSGLATVSAGIENAVIFSGVSLVGSLAGVVLIILGALKAYRR